MAVPIRRSKILNIAFHKNETYKVSKGVFEVADFEYDIKH